LWLFDPYLKFRERANFKLDDGMLTLQDYDKMRLINRTLLTIFVSDLQEMALGLACQQFSEISEFDPTYCEQIWADDCIDEELRKVLSKGQNGAHLSVDLTAHMDYFFNTRSCEVSIENPFHFADKYPALNHQVQPETSNFLSPVKSNGSASITLL
jgi:hypothetical protein